MNNIHEPDYKRVTLAIFLAAIVLIGWQMLVEWPRRQQLAQTVVTQTVEKEAAQAEKTKTLLAREGDTEYNPNLTRAQRLAMSKRVEIRSDTLHGSLALTGARLDDLTLSKYKLTLDKDSPDVTLLSPNGDNEAYFMQAGWVAADGKTTVPNQRSLWTPDKNTLTPNSPVNLRWYNGAGVTFVLTIALDADYMFTIAQRVENHSGSEIMVTPYGYINRALVDTGKRAGISHEGPLGVADNALTEMSYKDLREKGDKSYDNAAGWLGITDKYWLSALVPSDATFKTTFSHYSKNDQERYQVDYLGTPQSVSAGATQTSTLRMFAGAKELAVLDRYADGAGGAAPIQLFDRAVDFGMLYFLTKPMFLMLNFFYAHIGNFGLAIMMLTIVVKLCMFPLANKSYKSMSQMRVLQPEMGKIREKYFDDHIALNKEIMALYKRHKVNPASGCLPLLIQMPVFFALYKVLYVTIEMRHAPFFGWLKDLSALDPSNLFTLFGFVPWDNPSWLHLGILPIMMCISMIIQQRQQPAPTDPVQAKMMKLLPFMFLFFFASFPAGLVLYWVWSNSLSIMQSALIMRRHGKPAPLSSGASKS